MKIIKGVMKMTKEEVVSALENAVDTKIIIKDWKVLNKLIEEHFDPKPYTFEELKEGMWIWDNKKKECFKIFETHNEDMTIEVVVNDRDVYHTKIATLGKFEENRFYPPSKANEGKEQ